MITLDLPPQIETVLIEQADHAGLTVENYLIQQLEQIVAPKQGSWVRVSIFCSRHWINLMSLWRVLRIMFDAIFIGYSCFDLADFRAQAIKLNSKELIKISIIDFLAVP